MPHIKYGEAEEDKNFYNERFREVALDDILTHEKEKRLVEGLWRIIGMYQIGKITYIDKQISNLLCELGYQPTDEYMINPLMNI